MNLNFTLKNCKKILLLIISLLTLQLQSQTVTTLVSQFPGDGEISFDSSGNIYVNDSGENGNLDGSKVYVVNPNDGSFSLFHDNLPMWVVGSTFDLSGNLLVTGWAAGTVSLITPDGSMHTNIVPGGISGAGSLEINEMGHIFCAEYLTHSVLKFDGVSPPVYSSGTPIQNPAGLAYDQTTGNLYVSNWTNNDISVIDPNTQTATVFASLPVPNVGPIKIIGNYMLATSPQYHVIYKIEMANPSNVQLFAGTGVEGNQDGDISTATFNTPTGIGSIDGGNTIYVAEQYQYGIGLVTGRLRVIQGANLGVDDMQLNKPSISIYPNPVSKTLHVSSYGSLDFQNSKLEVEVYDIRGRNIDGINILKRSSSIIEINVEKLNSGLYFLNIKNIYGMNDYSLRFLKN